MNSDFYLIRSSWEARYARRMIISLIIGFVLGAATLLFALQNPEVVALSFMGWGFHTSLALVVLLSVGVGILLSILAFLPSAIASSFRIMGLKREKQKLADEVVSHQEALRAAAAEPKVVVVDSPRI